MTASILHRTIQISHIRQQLPSQHNDWVEALQKVGELSSRYRVTFSKPDGSFNCEHFIQVYQQACHTLNNKSAAFYERGGTPKMRFEQAYNIRLGCQELFSKLSPQLLEADRTRIKEAFQEVDVTMPVLVMRCLEAYNWASNPYALAHKNELNPWNEDLTINQERLIAISKIIYSILENQDNWMTDPDGKRLPNKQAKSALKVCESFLSFLRNSVKYNGKKIVAETALKLHAEIPFPSIKPFKIVFGEKEASSRESIIIHGMAKIILASLSPAMNTTFNKMKKVKINDLLIRSLKRMDLFDMMRLSIGDKLTSAYMIESNSPFNMSTRAELLDAYLDQQEPLTSNLLRYEWNLDGRSRGDFLIERIQLLNPQDEKDWDRVALLLEKCQGSEKEEEAKQLLKKYVLEAINLSPSLFQKLRQAFSDFANDPNVDHALSICELNQAQSCKDDNRLLELAEDQICQLSEKCHQMNGLDRLMEKWVLDEGA